MTRALPFGLGLLFILLGGGFFFWMAQTYRKVAPSYRWPEVQAVIETSSITSHRPTPNSPEQYDLTIFYHYQWQGQHYQAQRIRPRVKPYIRRVDAEDDAAFWPAGSTRSAWIDPQNPSYSLLERDSKAVLYAIAFPSIVILLGLGLCARALFPNLLRRNKRRTHPLTHLAHSPARPSAP